MNIGIIKIGQKIYFKRDSEACKRSNTNGNVGVYKLCKAMIENMPQDNFIFISPCDIEIGTYKNVLDDSPILDYLFVFAGLSAYENDDELYKYINACNYVLLSDDPRCLDDTLNNSKITNRPKLVLAQGQSKVTFRGKKIPTYYFPFEKIYLQQLSVEKKVHKMSILANTSGDSYRINRLAKMLKFLNVKVYGRLSDSESKKIGENKCVGEIKYEEAQSILRSSKSSYLIPVQKGLVTSKYIECLNNNCVPIFDKDYNTNYISFKPLIKAYNSLQLKLIYFLISIMPQSLLDAYIIAFRKKVILSEKNLIAYLNIIINKGENYNALF